MLTVKQHERLIDKISSLSEIELDALLKDIIDHLRRNNLNHLIQSACDVDDLEATIDDLSNELQNIKRERDDLQGTIDKIKQII